MLIVNIRVRMRTVFPPLIAGAGLHDDRESTAMLQRGLGDLPALHGGERWELAGGTGDHNAIGAFLLIVGEHVFVQAVVELEALVARRRRGDVVQRFRRRRG